jgi:hypothetical protein
VTSPISRIALLAAAVVMARTSHAEIPLPGASLAVANPPSLADCVEETALGERILSQLSSGAGNAPVSPPLRLEVTIERISTTLVAELRMSGRAGGSRRIEAERCEGLKEALAVTLAMILDQDALEGAVAATPAHPGVAPQPGEPAGRTATPAVTATPAPAAAPVAAPRSARAPAQSRGERGFRLGADQELRAWVGGGYGTSSTWRLEVGGEYASGGWATRLGAFYQPKRQRDLGFGQLRLLTMGGLAAGCRRFSADFRFVPCVLITLGAQRVEGIGFDRGSSHQLLVGSVGPALGVETGSRWVMGLELVGQVAWWRDEYVVENRQQTEKSPLFVAWLVARVALSSRPEPATGR